jgi:hypothetical protein
MKTAMSRYVGARRLDNVVWCGEKNDPGIFADFPRGIGKMSCPDLLGCLSGCVKASGGNARYDIS